MKKILLSLVALFATVSLVSALTYNVTVPAGTNECYIAGSFNGWSHAKMTKVNATTFTLTIATAKAADQYKYCSGPGWSYEEKTSSNGPVTNRTWVPEGDIVAKWAIIYDPGVVGKNVTYNVTVPANTRACYIAGGMNNWVHTAMTMVTPTTYTITIANVIDGMEYKYSSTPNWDGVETLADGSEKGNRTYTAADVVEAWKVPTAISEAAFDAAVVAANGTISADADFSIINLAGVDVTAQNGSLAAGAYIVKLANGAAQVVTLK